MDHLDKGTLHSLAAKSPFRVAGAPNVKLETVKRGEDDEVSGEGDKTIILRLYEHFGGHARATLKT
jgi:alpha-mannosidase